MMIVNEKPDKRVPMILLFAAFAVAPFVITSEMNLIDWSVAIAAAGVSLGFAFGWLK